MPFTKKQSVKKIDFTDGKLFGKILRFALPLMATGVLQTMYNMADKIIVGKFSGDPLAIAAVGSVTPLANIVVSLLMNITAGVSVVIARSYGAGDKKAISKASHTAITISALAGILLMIIGLIVSRPALLLMNTKPELFESGLVYVRIIFIGIPAASVYNFAAAILRSSGDSKTPLTVLSSTGILNVILNVLFVLAFDMAADGVALATIISQYISAIIMIAVIVYRKDEAYTLKWSLIGIDKKILTEIMRIGIPTAIHGSMFSISNTMLAGAANTLPTVDISAKSISDTIGGMVNTAMSAYSQASITSVAQNYGAKRYDRIKKSLAQCLIQTAVVGITLAAVVTAFDTQFIGMFVDPADSDRMLVIESCKRLMRLLIPLYFICGMMNSVSGALRGIGYSVLPMITSIIGVCGLRVVWIYTAFTLPALHTMPGLYLSYPITWAITTVTLLIEFFIIYNKLVNKKEDTLT